MEWFLVVVRDNYANFTGRARRKEYWMFYLFSLLFSWGLTLIDFLLFRNVFLETGIGIFSTVFSLIIFIPSLAAFVRRLHDTGRSGWWILLSFVIIIGWIILLVWLATEGDVGDNQYGPDPKAGEFGH